MTACVLARHASAPSFTLTPCACGVRAGVMTHTHVSPLQAHQSVHPVTLLGFTANLPMLQVCGIAVPWRCGHVFSNGVHSTARGAWSTTSCSQHVLAFGVHPWCPASHTPAADCEHHHSSLLAAPCHGHWPLHCRLTTGGIRRLCVRWGCRWLLSALTT